MRDKIGRYTSALIVSLVSMYCGASRYAFAETPATQACGLNDALAWQMQLDAPEEEATPAYIRRITEDFIARCPNRPEVPSAHQVAGMAAGWEGLSEVSVQHFRKAGAMRDSDALFMAAAGELHTGNSDIAWALRDRAIALWTQRLAHRGAEVESFEVRGGTIHAIRFAGPRASTGATHIWLAQPDGPGWPGVLTLQSSDQLNALHRLTAGEDAKPISHLRFVRCQSRRLLARTEDAFTEEELEELAEQSLTAYLADPDREGEEEYSTCILARHMLAEPQDPALLLTQ